MGGERSKLSKAELVIRCAGCGHSAVPRGRVADLAGKTLRCTQCGARQRLDMAQIIEAAYRQHEQMQKAAKEKPEPSPAAIVSEEGKGTLH